MTFGSLFAGIGGMDLGLERAGMTCCWQVEIEPFRRRVLEKHWPHVRRHDDVRTFPVGDAGDWRVDLVCGGFPCKQTSTASAIHGRREGLESKDSGLWHEQLRVIRAIRPAWAIVENVHGAATWAGEIEAGMEAAGYAVSRLVLAASSLGAPHRRRRMFFVANAHGERLSLPGEGGPSEAGGDPGRAADGNPWLEALAGGMRVADGLPPGVDRRRRIVALGDAVVPAVAERIGRMILRANCSVSR
jgi:DNA (cytosine-5)-methyltransferase 1